MPDDDLQPIGLTRKRPLPASVLPMPGVPEAAMSKAPMSLGQPATPNEPPNPYDEAISKGLALGATPALPQSPLPKPPMAAAGDVPQQPQSQPFFSKAERGIHNPVLRTLAEVGDVAGGILAPGIESHIPGTRAAEQAGQSRALGIEKEQAGIAEEKARAGEEQARGQAALHPQPKQEEAGKTITTDEGVMQWNPATQKYDIKAGNAAEKKATAPHVTYDAGIPVSVTAGDKTYDVNDPKLPPELKPLVDSANRAHGQHVQEESTRAAEAAERAAHAGDTKRSAAEMTQVERESRQNIRKAEGKYRDTQKSVGQLSSAIDAAKDGNGLLTSFVPTMEVLGINAANGVHRISPAEAHAANLPGSWAERFNAWFDKATTGKVSPQLVAEGKALAKILRESAYKEYKATYDDEHGIVSGYGGKDFEKRVPAIKEDEEGGAGSEPIYAKNPKTGERKMSTDGGKTWQAAR